MFAKLLCIKSMQYGLPVVVVDRYLPGISRFIESIEQQIVVLFDEFDKTFSGNMSREANPAQQTELLSLFDGISPGKKMFVITCNELRNVSDYLVNRPGRFHYHFRFEYPTPEEICEYMRDHIAEQYYDQIEAVISFANKITLNYDCLRSIAFELNLGISFADAIRDLNIINVSEERYDAEIRFKDGTVLTCRNHSMDLFSRVDDIYIPFYNRSGDAIAGVTFNSENIVYDTTSYTPIVPGECVTKDWVAEDEDDGKRVKDLEIEYIRIRRRIGKDIHYAA